ncbi:efflux RND transporter periplasmic adaptor subunit [Sinomicrobium sp. M5D2P9]
MKQVNRNGHNIFGKRNMYAVFTVTIVLTVLPFFISCNKKTPETSRTERYCLDESFREDIILEPARLQPVQERIALTGIVQSNPDKVVPFTSLVGGVVSRTYFSLGDVVSKGQVLAEIQSSELNNLQSERKSLEGEIMVAERELLSVRSMYEDGIASQKDFLTAQSELKTKQAALENVTATLGLYGSSKGKDGFQVKAPMSGAITEKNIASGMQISAEGNTLFTVADLSEVWVILNIYAGNVTKLHIGQEVDIQTLSYPDKIFKGTITSISQVFDNEERVLKAWVVIPNENQELKPGMSADIIAKKQRDRKAVTIPTSALIFNNNRNFVVVYKDDCDLEVRRAEVFSKNGDETYITGGVEANELVVTRNQLLIYEQIKDSGND